MQYNYSIISIILIILTFLYFFSPASRHCKDLSSTTSVFHSLTFATLFSQATFPALYQSLCLSDSDLWLSFSQSSQCEQEIPSTIAKKITPFQQVTFQSKTKKSFHQLNRTPYHYLQTISKVYTHLEISSICYLCQERCFHLSLFADFSEHL